MTFLKIIKNTNSSDVICIMLKMHEIRLVSTQKKDRKPLPSVHFIKTSNKNGIAGISELLYKFTS